MKQNKIFQVAPDIDQSDIKSVVNYLESGGWLTEHSVTEKLNQKIANYVNRDFSTAVPNGTIAIYLALLAAGITKGCKVAVPNLTMIATINSVIWADATPVLVDVDENLCMSYEKLSELNNIDAVIFVPLNGRTGDGEKIEQWCQQNGIVLIEDSAHALGSNYSKKRCGSLGDISIFSFTPHKIITMGQGGMILTNNKNIYENIIDLKTFNREKDQLDWHKGFGLNFKITDLQSTIGLSQFKKLNKYIDAKKNNWQLYKELIISADISFRNFNEFETPWFFDILVNNMENKKAIKNILVQNNIETRDCYPALSYQTYLKEVDRTDLSLSESMSERILWLPSSNNLKKEEIVKISTLINSIA